MEQLRKAFIIAPIITLLGIATNIIGFYAFGNILIGKTIIGGEYMGKIGFGLIANFVYPLTLQGSSEVPFSWLSLDPINLILTFFLIFLISAIILTIIDKYKKH